MPKIVGRNERGFVDPLSLFGLLFLVVTLAAVTFVTTNKNISLNISEKAGIDGGVMSPDYDLSKVLPAPVPPVVAPPPPPTNPETTSNTCDANGTQYNDGSKVIGGSDGGNSGYSKCVNGRWTDCPECTLTSLTTVPVYKQAEYLAAIKAQQKAQQEAEQIKRQEARLAQADCNTQGGKYQSATGMCLVISTSQTLEKTDEGFITNSTTYVRDINTGKIVDAKTTSYIAKTTTTSVENQGNAVTTSITSYINPDTGQYYTDSTGKAIVNITGLSIIPPTTSLSDKRPVGAGCTDSSECGSGSCGMQGHGRAGPPTLACLPQVLPDNNYGSCNGDPTCNSALTSIDRGMNAISFGGWSNYTEAYSPDKVKYTWQESGYKSVKECQDDMIAKNNNAQAAASCNTYQITKEQAISSIKLGTTLTAEAAVIIALPGAIGAGGTAITAGATTLQVGGAVLAPALTSFGAITTLTQTSAAAVAQITDPGSPEAWKQTGYAALSWLNIGTADKLIKSFGALDAAKKAGQATETLVTAAQSARNLNNVVSGINLAVDVPNAVSTCSQAGFFTGSCGGALAAVGADIVFGTVDYKQGQLGFGNPLTKVNEGALIGPLPDIKDPNGTRIATPAEIDQINQLIANPFGTTPSISNVDGEVKFTPSRQLDMFDQLARDPVANTSTVVNNSTELIFPDKPARQDPNTNFNLTKSDPNEVAAIAAFNSTDINTQGGTVAQLTPSNLNSQIPNTPITDVTAPKPVEPNANIADDITKPLTGTANTDTVDSPATTNQSPTIASLLDDPNASVLDKANGVIDTLPDTGGAISIVKKINQIGDEIAKVDVNTPKPLRENLFGEPKTKKFSNVKTGETILIKPGDTIRTGNFETKMPKPDDYPDGIFWTKNPGDTPQRLTGEGVPITKGNSAENINFADKDGGRIAVDSVEHTTDANGRPITKPTASTAITLTDELNVQTTITRAASETGLLTFRGPDGEWFPGLKKLFGNGKPAAPTSNEAVIGPSEKLVDPETSANNSGATNNEKTVSTAEELFDHFKKEYKSELPENLVVHKDPNDFYSFQQELIDAAKNGEITDEFLAQKMRDLQGRGNVTFVIKDPGEINDISGGIAYTQKVLNPKTGKYEITVFLPSPANLAEYKNIDIEPARIKIAELIGHESGHAYDEVGLSAIGVNPNSSGGLWATEYLQQNFSNEFQKALGVENPVKDGFVKGVEAQANIVKNTSGEPLPATKQPSALAAWWDSTVVKPLGDIIFGKKPIFLDNLDTPLPPTVRGNAPVMIKPVETQTVKIPYSKELDPLIEVKNAWNKYGDRLTTAYNNKDVQGLIDIAKENGYQVKIVPFGEKVDIVEIGGKTTKMPMTKADTVRIGKSGGKKTLFIATTDVSNPTFKIDDLAHDIGAVITDVKFIPIEKIDISPYSFADFMTRATGEKWNASDIAKNFGTQLNGRTKSVEVPITYIVDALTFGEVPSNFLESVPVKITIPQKFTNWVKDEMAKTNPNAFDNLKNGFELRSPISTDGKLQLPFEKVTLPKNIEPEIDLNKLEVKDVPSWENVKNKEVATIIDVENIDSIPPLKGRDFIPQVKPVRELYPVEIVNNIFFSEKSADSGRKLVQDYLQALKNGEDVSEYQKIAKSFLNDQEKVYGTQSQSAKSKLASWISRNYNDVDVNSLPTENIDDLALVRVMSSPDPIGVDPYGNVVIQSTFLGNPQKDAESLYRTSKHFTVNGAVAPVQTAYGRIADWSAGDVIVITPMNEFVKINGTPNTFAVQDTWWTPGTYDNLVLPKGTVLIIKDGSEALKEYANLPGVLIIKSENPYKSSRIVLEQSGYQYKAQGTEYSEPDTPEEVFLNESVFAYNIGANSGLHFDSPTMNVGNELSTRLLTDETINNMFAWSEGNLSRHQRLNTVVDLIQDGYFSSETINGLYIPPGDIPSRRELTPVNFDRFNSPLTNSQIKAVEDIINNEKLTLPSYWENQGVIAEYQQLIKDSFVDPTLSSGLPLLKPDIFGLTNEDTNFLRQNVNELTKTTIPVSEKLVTENLDAADNTIKLNETPEQSKPTIFGFEYNGFKNSDGNFTLWPLEKITTPNPPIKPGEVFDPNIEIKNILKSPNRTEALADFKTKLAYQQKGMAKIQTELEKTILNNPAVTFDELTSQVNSLSKTYGLSNTQMGKLEDALTIYQERTTRISELLSDYPDKNDLFQAMFGKKPVGRIEISRGPISIHIKAYNAEDYGYLGNRDFTDPAIPTNTNDANTSGGFFKPSGTLLPDTEGLIIVENNTKWYYKFFAPDVVGIHEDQHALNNLLKQADIYPAPLSGYSDSYYNLQEALELGDNKLINTSLQNYLDRVKTSANYNVMDEMLAMLKDGTSNSTITKYITQPKNNGGIYDFYGRRKEEVTKIFDTEDLAANKSIQEIIDQNLGTNASKTVINNGLKAFDNLLSKGYTRDEALALLEKTALSDWPKVSERAPIPNFVTRTTSYISGKIVTPTNLAHFQTPSNYLMAGGIIYQVYNINKIVNLASNFGWDNTGALLKDWWQDRNPFSSTLPTSETPTGDEKVSESSLINVVNPPPAIPPVIPDSPAKTNEQQKLELERQAKIKSGLYAQIDADLATQTILGGAGKPFKNIGCGQVAVANILCEYGNYCPTPLQIAEQIPLQEYAESGLTSTQSNIKILNENGFTTDPYTKSLQYHLTDYMEPTDVLWISGIVGGIDHHTYIDGYTLDKNGVAIYNLNDSYFGDGYKCKISGDSSFSCDNPDGSHINIGAENANIYIIDTNI